MSTWQSGSVEVNGLRLHFTRSGGEKSPLVMAHGITDNGLCWTRLARVLEQYHDVIMVDARGHGESDKPESGYSPEQHTEDLAGVIRALGVEGAILMGHSMGAGTVTRLAALYPELVEAVILEDPPWRLPGGPDDTAAKRESDAAMWRKRILAHQASTPAEIADAGRIEHPTWAFEEFEWWVPAKLQVSPAVVEAVIEGRRNWPELVASFKCPALLLYGEVERGGIVSPEIAAYARQLNPLVMPRQIPHAGHNVRRENFEATVSALQEFLALVRRRSERIYA